ncbi:MAG: DUF6325 family protein [Caldilinea sp.]
MQSTLGPVEYLVLYFEGNQFRGEIIPALRELVDSGMIRIIDLGVIIKNDVGDVLLYESSELSAEVADALAQLEGEHDDLLSEEDLLMVAEDLPNNSTAAAILFEHVWAARFAQAVRNANGEVLMNVRIPNQVVEDVRQTLIDVANIL